MNAPLTEYGSRAGGSQSAGNAVGRRRLLSVPFSAFVARPETVIRAQVASFQASTLVRISRHGDARVFRANTEAAFGSARRVARLADFGFRRQAPTGRGHDSFSFG